MFNVYTANNNMRHRCYLAKFIDKRTFRHLMLIATKDVLGI